MTQCPIIEESTTTLTKNKSIDSQKKTEEENLLEEKLSEKQLELDLMWDRIQELKFTDEFAAAIMYDKYRRMSGEIPPPVPSSSCIIDDQAVS